MRGLKHRFHQTIVALDQVLNAMLGGWADETISSRAYRLQDKHKHWAITRKVLDIIFFFDEEHCKTSYYSEKMRQHMPPEIRDTDPRIQ